LTKPGLRVPVLTRDLENIHKKLKGKTVAMRYHVNPVAKTMAYERERYRQQVVRDRTKYTRKTKHGSKTLDYC